MSYDPYSYDTPTYWGGDGRAGYGAAPPHFPPGSQALMERQPHIYGALPHHYRHPGLPVASGE